MFPSGEPDSDDEECPHAPHRHPPPYCRHGEGIGQPRFLHAHARHAARQKTVNQDDVSAYHLFYADALGSPGTDLTFFDWPVGPERRGTGSIVRTSLWVAGEDALRWWRQRFGDVGVEHSGVVKRDGRETLDF